MTAKKVPATEPATGSKMRTTTSESRVTALELFFDLVFVFAVTQVTSLLAANMSALGILQGLLVLALLWWCWVGYSWLGNVVQADEGWTRVTMFAAMIAMFVLALCVPEAFDDAPGGLNAPIVLGICYLLVRSLHLLAFWLAAGAVADRGLRRQLRKFTPSMLGSSALLLLASHWDGQEHRFLVTGIWLAVVVVDYGGTIAGGSSGWRLDAPAHFAERHGLVIIVALGESLIAMGATVAQVPLSLPIIAATMLGLIIAGCLWWAYFDVVALRAEQALTDTTGEQRTRLARDAYSYLHLPMITGIILVALGLKKTLTAVGQPGADLHLSLKPLEATVLFCGAALYLLAQVALRWRITRTLSRQRLATAVLLLAATPASTQLPALAALAAITLTLVALISYETLRYAEFRDQVRHAPEGGRVARQP